MSDKSIIFKNATGIDFTYTGLIQRISDYIRESPESYYRIMIGTDSLPAHEGRVIFITAVVVHRVGRGGIYFWQKNHGEKLFTLRDRMYQEALWSLSVAQILMSNSKYFELKTKKVEIHLDIGEAGDTRAMIREIVGMVTAHGFDYQIKPFSFAASKVADRHVVYAD